MQPTSVPAFRLLPQKAERQHGGNPGPTKNHNTARQATNLLTLYRMSKGYLDVALLPALWTATYFLFLDWLYFMYTVFQSRHPIALTAPTSWSLQCNPDYTFTTLCNGLSGLPYRDNSQIQFSACAPQI